MEHASLHIVMGATHCFTQSLVDTVIQQNLNPIEKVERSLLIMAATLHEQTPTLLVQGTHVARLAAATPALFPQLLFE